MAEYLNGSANLQEDPSGNGTLVTATIAKGSVTIDSTKDFVIATKLVITDGGTDKVYTIVQNFPKAQASDTSFVLTKAFSPTIDATTVKSTEAYIVTNATQTP